MAGEYLRSRWPTLLGLLLLLQPAWKACRWVLDRVGYVDLVSTHISQPGWVGAMIDWVLTPPPWSFIPMILIGFGLIYWDNARRLHTPTSVAQSFMPFAPGPHGILTFDNKTPARVDLYWFNHQGERVPIGAVAPGTSISHNVSRGDTFVAVSGGRDLMVHKLKNTGFDSVEIA